MQSRSARRRSESNCTRSGYRCARRNAVSSRQESEFPCVWAPGKLLSRSDGRGRRQALGCGTAIFAGRGQVILSTSACDRGLSDPRYRNTLCGKAHGNNYSPAFLAWLWLEQVYRRPRSLVLSASTIASNRRIASFVSELTSISPNRSMLSSRPCRG